MQVQKPGATSPAFLLFAGENYSYLRLSTGSNCAARVAGTVPKITPTIVETIIAIIADNPEIGIRKAVNQRTDSGSASPIIMPRMPPESEMNNASAMN